MENLDDYKYWDIKRLHAYMRKFHNIEKLKEAFEASAESRIVLQEAEVFEKEMKVKTDEFSKIEKEFNDDIEKDLREYLIKVVDIMREFEKSYEINTDTV